MAPAFRRDDENRPQRWILASSGVDGTAVPGSLSEGAAERSEAEGVSFVGCCGPLVYHAAPLALKFLSGYVPSGDTPSVSLSLASSLREGAGNGCGECVPLNEVLAKPQGFGRFSSPLRRLWYFYLLPLIGGHSLSQPLRAASSLREGAGDGCGECVPFNEVLAKPQGFGRFSSPLRRL